MAQLPPKVPTMTQNWPSFPFQMMPFPSSSTAAAAAAASSQQNSSWVDEFLDFSSARRNSHRRSVSDPIAFVEAPNNNGFEKLDDEQLRTMFSDDVAAMGLPTMSSSNPSSTNPSTPSDQNSENDEKNAPPPLPLENQNLQPKIEPGEVDSSCKIQIQSQPSTNSSANNASPDAIVDPKRIKR